MNTVLLCIVLFLLSSCTFSPIKPTKEEALAVFIREADIDISDYESILFIPMEGCDPCIRSGIDFYEKNADNTNILFIFSTYKPYAYSLLKNNDNFNVIVDKKSLAIKNQLLETAPVAYKKYGEEFKYLGVANSEFNFSTLF